MNITVTKVLVIEDDILIQKIILESFAKLLPEVEISLLKDMPELDEILQIKFNYILVDGDLERYPNSHPKLKKLGTEVIPYIKKLSHPAKLVAIATYQTDNELLKRSGAHFVLGNKRMFPDAIANGLKAIIEGGASHL